MLQKKKSVFFFGGMNSERVKGRKGDNGTSGGKEGSGVKRGERGREQGAGVMFKYLVWVTLSLTSAGLVYDQQPSLQALRAVGSSYRN